jgi:ribosomal protein S18 acetylase RimI-like enzyme
MTMAALLEPALTVRPLCAEDLDAVVGIDTAAEGRSRRTYFEARLAAAQRQPALHAQFAAVEGGRLAGYVLARVLEGEFGRPAPGLRIEAVGVRAEAQHQGIGQQLVEALAGWARAHAIGELHTLASWRQHAMLGWLDALGFELAPAQVLDSPVGGGAYTPGRDGAVDETAEQPREVNYGDPRGDYGRLARDLADVRTMARDDLAEIVRVDSGIVGHPRQAHIGRLLEEATADSSIRVSLTARLDGAVVGYLMARADRGDFGRTEPVVVLDTIGVDPEYARRGVGRALLSQLFANLGALRIERVETVVAPRDFALLGFLHATGFAPSQRLAFVKRVD